MRESTLRQSLDLLRTRRFGTFWFASLLSSIGTWAQLVAEPWLLLSLGASSFLIGLDSFAMSAPVWLLTLAGGVLADRADRRRIIAGFQSVQMLCPTLIVVLLLAGTLQPWMIIALSLVVGVTDALSMPSFSSIVPSIVERDQIGAGLALNSTQFNASRVAGPALAGVLMVSVGAIGCFVVSALSYLPFIGVALWILPRRPPTQQAYAPGQRHPLAGVGEIIRQPHFRGALLTTLVSALLCGPLITFCPVLVKSVFNGSASQFSAAVSAFGAGGVLGAIGLLAVDPRRDRRSLNYWFAAGYAVTLIAVALDPWFWALPVILVLAGVSMSVSNTAANTVLQASASAHLRGQAVSLYMLAMRGGIALGSLVTGMTVTLLGVRAALLANGILTLVALAIIGRGWLLAPVPEPH
jgi:predicted MFS family arabinose efflux permease